MINEEQTIVHLKKLKSFHNGSYGEDIDRAIKALEIVSDFEKARIITGGRLNVRTYAYKCGLADGQRLAKGEKLFNILPLKQQAENEDCISREAVKEMLTEEWTKYMPMVLAMNLSFVLEKIGELPSVTLKALEQRYKPIILKEHDAEPRTMRALLDTATDEIYVCRITRQGAEILGMTIEDRNADEGKAECEVET